MNIDVNWEIDASDIDVNHDDYDSYVIIQINTDDTTKEIWSVTYKYIWNCGDGCCSNTETDVAYVGQIAQWLKDKILEKLPDHKFQGLRSS